MCLIRGFAHLTASTSPVMVRAIPWLACMIASPTDTTARSADVPDHDGLLVAESADRQPYMGTTAAYDGLFGRSLSMCINRHHGGINMPVCGLVRRGRSGLKELWTLKWHGLRTRRTAGPGPAACSPEDWPEWMQGFKDYWRGE